MENNNRWGFTWGSPLGVLAIVLTLFLAAQAIKSFESLSYVGRDVPATNTVTVSGKGEVFAAPDIATFSFTVQDQNLVVSKAQDAVTKDMNDILAFLKKSGVADKDIRTQNYSISPHYEYQSRPCSYTSGAVSSDAYGVSVPMPVCPPSRNVLTGYDVVETVQVKVRTLANAGKLVTGIGELGATEISGLQFSVDKEEVVQRQARQKAIVDAQARAKELASDLGVQLVRIVSYSESGPYPIYYAKSAAMGMGGGMAPDAAALPAGENQFTSNVSITYEVR